MSIKFNVQTNAGYSAEQVEDQSITLGDLLKAVQEAIEAHGQDEKVVLYTGKSYGADYGYISQYEDLFEVETPICGVCGSELDGDETGECRVCGSEI